MLTRREVGERLRQRRLRLGWSQADLALHLGLAQGTVSNLERGLAKRLEPRQLRQLAAFIEVPYEDLYRLFWGEEPGEAALVPDEQELLDLYGMLPTQEERDRAREFFRDFVLGRLSRRKSGE